MDQKPPRVLGDERATLQSLLQYQRDSVVRKVAGVADEDARTSPVATGTSLLWLLKHLVMAETVWVLIRFAGRDLPLPDDMVHDDDTVGGAVEAYRRTWALVDEVVAAADLEDLCQTVNSGELPDLRWVLAHLLEETARHAGHADILRELLDGATGR
jgi:hypothetical protein